MLILNNDEVSALLSMDKCLEHLERAYREQAEGTAVNRPRSDLYMSSTAKGGVYCFKTMEGGLTGESVVALRLNSDVIRWQDKGGRIIKDKIPAAPGNKWVGLVLLFSAETGEPLAIMPDGIIQGIRVAASSALAARYLSRSDAAILGILGSGWQARAHAKAISSVRQLKKMLVHSPTKANREKFALEVQNEVGVAVEPVESGEAVAAQADILVAATNSVSRVVPPEWLRPGMHLTCVKITELGDATLKKADRLVIHSRKWAPDNYITGFGDRSVQAHDPIDLVAQGTKAANTAPKEPFWLDAPQLKDVVAGKVPGRQSAQEISCFNNNIGLGIQFAALGKAVLDDARAKGSGKEIPTDWFLETVHP
ncbi:MAG TPA: ornithine cyclodeaminase family protein [Candidatus Binatia bacterium]|jgi:ornithine cyclodeaminase/alanine dehydrogenase-like protein (mu-crystallin family)